MLEIKNLEFFGYGNLLKYDLTAKSGSLTLVSGPSGQGKTTLLSIIAGFITPKSGNVIFNNQNLLSIDIEKRPVSLLFQDHNLFPHLNAWDNIAIGINASLKLSDDQKNKIMEISDELGIKNYLKSYPEELSGGQKQRISIARVLLRKRPLLLLDEPFIGLDRKCIEKCMGILNRKKEKYNLTILLVSHQYEEIKKYADQIVNI